LQSIAADRGAVVEVAIPKDVPGGSKIVYTLAYRDTTLGWTGSDLWVMDADGTNQTQLTDTLFVCEKSPKWSPDGIRILYRRCMNSNEADIWVINADGSNPHVLVSQVNAQHFDWSPDGSGYLTRLTPSDDYYEHTPLWGPDGTILYRSDELTVKGNTDYSSTWVMRSDGSNKRMVNPWGGKWHEFSPSGEWIVFQTCEPPTTASAQLFIMRNPLYGRAVPTLMPIGILALRALLSVIVAISITRKREGK
jgi:Tol biopolymer transport system component